MRLRPATVGDVDALARLWHDGWLAGHADIVPSGLVQHRDLASFRARIEMDLISFQVAERDGGLAGFIRVVGDELDQFYVAPDLIGTGVAADLMNAAEGALRTNGVQRPYLIAAEGNDRAIRFYEKQGWQNRGREQADVTTLEGPFRMWVIRLEKQL